MRGAGEPIDTRNLQLDRTLGWSFAGCCRGEQCCRSSVELGVCASIPLGQEPATDHSGLTQQQVDRSKPALGRRSPMGTSPPPPERRHHQHSRPRRRPTRAVLRAVDLGRGPPDHGSDHCRRRTREVAPRRGADPAARPVGQPGPRRRGAAPPSPGNRSSGQRSMVVSRRATRPSDQRQPARRTATPPRAASETSTIHRAVPASHRATSRGPCPHARHTHLQRGGLATRLQR